MMGWIGFPPVSVIGFVGDTVRPFVKFDDPADTVDINGESSENSW